MVLSDINLSPRKRKRVAGIWDDIELDLPDSIVEKRARVDVTTFEAEETKENISPASDELTPDVMG